MITRYLNLSKKIFLSNFRRLGFPYKLTFAITYQCNYRCRTCEIWKKKPVNELSTEEIEQFFSHSNDFSWIDLTGGEPSLRKDFVDICQIISRYCKKLVLFHFPTNGYLTKKIVNDVKQIRQMGPFKIIITVSTDGDEALNDEIRGVKGGWRRQMETFKQLHEIDGVEVVLGMTLSGLNYDKFEVAYNAAKDACPWLKPKDFHLSLMNYSEHFYGNEPQRDSSINLIKEGGQMLAQMLKTSKQYRKTLGIPTNPRAFLESTFHKKAESFFMTGKTPIPCHALKSSCFIAPSGEVYPCITFNRPLSNLRDYDYNLRNIWNLQTTRLLQEKIWDFKCPQCWTGCDGYQSILGNIFPFGKRSGISNQL